MSLRDNPLKPIKQIILVEESSCTVLAPESVAVQNVGKKAFGLSAIPEPWTLPFFVVSCRLLNEAKNCGIESAIDKWLPSIKHAATMVGLKDSDLVFLRSSSIVESLPERGKFITLDSELGKIGPTLKKYAERTLSDTELNPDQIFITVQKGSLISEKGHLSNERRCYRESRDWLGQIEKASENYNFQINLRNWRDELDVTELQRVPLTCLIGINLQKTLKNVAKWGKKLNGRFHFEWVWDGRTVFLVQIDQEDSRGGYNPKKIVKVLDPPKAKHAFKALREIDDDAAGKFSKIHNVSIYKNLGLATVPIYILDNRNVIERIANNDLDDGLCNDLRFLTSRSLVIRVDISDTQRSNKQLLPRTPEVRSYDDAVRWLTSTASQLLQDYGQFDIAFIFHNFIPAVSSAFAFAAPGERKVQIESLWGIPEGLYYNSHDKCIVDTGNAKFNLATDKLSEFSIKKVAGYKPYCVAPENNGDWKTQAIRAPYDWSFSITTDAWIRQIAIDSRAIAEKENQSVSIMWFIGVPRWAATASLVPWFHEPYEKDRIPRTKNRRKKTPFDQHFTIQTQADIEKFAAEVGKGNKTIRQVLVKPMEEKLLRDKYTLRKVGQLAKAIDAVILLEGATLSHVFYQLQEVGATVNIELPFQKDTDAKDFHKLVRDGIPERIREGGELVTTKSLVGEDLIKALREKLVEEAIEVLDAKNYDSVLDELADVYEVIDGIVHHLGAGFGEISARKEKKKKKVGGFAEGLVLVETSNPSPSSVEDSPNLSLPLDEPNAELLLSHTTQPELLKRRTDTRIHLAAEELLLTFELPLLLDRWEVETQELLDKKGKNRVSVKGVVQGRREGAKIRIELSIYSSPKQLDILDDAN